MEVPRTPQVANRVLHAPLPVHPGSAPGASPRPMSGHRRGSLLAWAGRDRLGAHRYPFNWPGAGVPSKVSVILGLVGTSLRSAGHRSNDATARLLGPVGELRRFVRSSRVPSVQERSCWARVGETNPNHTESVAPGVQLASVGRFPSTGLDRDNPCDVLRRRRASWIVGQAGMRQSYSRPRRGRQPTIELWARRTMKSEPSNAASRPRARILAYGC